MWLTEVLFGRNVRNPMKKFTNYRYVYPYRQFLPAALRDSVSGKGVKQKKAACLQEMSSMLVCLKKYDFDQSRCPKEIEAFMTCNQLHLAQGGAVSRPGWHPREQVVEQLQRYPQYPPTKQ